MEDIDAMGNKIKVKYVGRRELFTDPLYGTGSWTEKTVKVVPADLFAKMKKHVDIFKCVSPGEDEPEGGEQAEQVEPENGKKETEEDNLEDVRVQVRLMTRKKGLAEFAKTNFNVDLPADNTVKLIDLKEQVIRLIDQFGLPGDDDGNNGE
jgi:hypothetical protein